MHSEEEVIDNDLIFYNGTDISVHSRQTEEAVAHFSDVSKTVQYQLILASHMMGISGLRPFICTSVVPK